MLWTAAKFMMNMQTQYHPLGRLYLPPTILSGLRRRVSCYSVSLLLPAGKNRATTQASPASRSFWRCARPELGVAAAIHPDRRRPVNLGLER